MNNKFSLVIGFVLMSAFRVPAYAGEMVCAVVNLELGQQSALEREGFNAKLALTNNLGDLPLSNLRVEVSIKDAAGQPADHLFFTKVTDLENIAAIDGTGVVQPAGRAVMQWLIIPSPGAGGMVSSGVRYNVTARMTYYTGGVPRVTTTFPAVITVKPQPLLRLEYVLPFEVFGDDPVTAAVESPEPFPLGLRVSNVGAGTAKNFRVDTGQPLITVNEQGLVSNLQILGNWLGANALPDKTFAIQFGDIAPGGSKQAAWSLASSLSGRFTDFTAGFTHSAELGGALTSLIDSASTYTLIKDVMVELPGRDAQFDFLINKSVPRGLLEEMYQRGEEPAPEFLMESDRTELALVQNVPAHLTGSLSGSNSVLRLVYDTPVLPGAWVHASLPAPEGGLSLLSVMRADGKQSNPRNVWISRHYNKVTLETIRHLHILDYTGAQSPDYALTFNAAALDTPPAGITDLALHPVGTGAMALTWTAAGEDGTSGTVYGGRYAIFYSTEAGVVPSSSSAQILLATTTAAGAAQEYLLPELLGNATYQLAVFMADAQGRYSAASNPLITQTAILPPAGIENIMAGIAALNVGWLVANNNSPVEYSIRVDTDAFEPVVLASPFKDSSDRSFMFTGLAPNTTYLVYGQAKNPESGSASVQAYLGGVVTLAAQPGPLSASTIFNSSFTLAWEPNANPDWTEYLVQISTMPDWASIAGESGWVKAVEYTFSGLFEGTSYYARVKARNSAGTETAFTELGIIKTGRSDFMPPVTEVRVEGGGFRVEGKLFIASGTIISLTASDDASVAGDKLGVVATSYYSVDSDTFSVYAGTFSIVNEGEHSIRFYSVDLEGNEEAVKTSSITVDNTAPVTTLIVNGRVVTAPAVFVTAGASITFEATDNASGISAVWYFVDSGTATAFADAFTLGIGTHSITYWSVDNVGNAEAAKTVRILAGTAPVKLSLEPETLNLGSKGEVITAGLTVENGKAICFSRADIKISAINGQELETPIYALGSKGGDDDLCGSITAKFDRAEVIAVLPVNASVKVTVSGEFADGHSFSADDTIRTIKPSADPEFRLGEVYVLPNPAKGGAKPVFHIETGIADSVKIMIRTVSGMVVHERTITGMPRTLNKGGNLVYVYEYAWEGKIPGGVYSYAIEAEKAGQKLKKGGMFAVMR